MGRKKCTSPSNHKLTPQTPAALKKNKSGPPSKAETSRFAFDNSEACTVARPSNSRSFEIQLPHLAATPSKRCAAIHRTSKKGITPRQRMPRVLRESEVRFRLMADVAPVMIWESGTDARCTYCNKPWLNFTGRSMEQELGNGWAEGVHPDDLLRLVNIFDEVVKTPDTTQSADYRIRRRDGSWRFLESIGKTLRDETGAMTIVVNSRDITERKWAEEQIQFLYRTAQAVNQAANFHEALGIALREICTLTGWDYGEAWVPSADGKRLECSPAWHGDSRHLSAFRKYSEELRYEANESIPGRVWLAKQMEWMCDLTSQPRHIFRRASIARESGLKSALGVPILADGETLAVLLFFSTEMRVENQRLIMLFSTVAGQLGTTLRRKLAEQELISSRQQLRNLSIYLQSTREEERTHVAREIHDELGQILTALKMDLSWLGKHLSADDEPLYEKTTAMTRLVDTTIQAVQRISAELRPGILDNLGLAAAMEWQTRQFKNRTGIDCEFVPTPENIVLDRDRATAIFRIFQEALTNIARHAEAAKAFISLRQDTHTLVLRVRDDGKGITPQQVFDQNSFGLIGTRERVHPWGGTVKIKGVPGKGTVVFVSLPVNTLPHVSPSPRHD